MIARLAALALVLAVACGGTGRAAPSASGAVVIASPSATPLIDVTDMMGGVLASTFLVRTADGVKGFALLNHALKYTIPVGRDAQITSDDRSGRVYVLDSIAGGARLRRFDPASGSEQASQVISGASAAAARTPHSGLAVDASTGILYALLRRPNGISVERFDWFTLAPAGALWSGFRCGEQIAAAAGRVVVACMDDPTGGLVVKEGDVEFKDGVGQAFVALAMAPDGTVLAVAKDGRLLRLPRRTTADTLAALKSNGTGFETLAAFQAYGGQTVADGIATVADCCAYVSVLDDVDRPQLRALSGLSGITLIVFPRSAAPTGGVFVKPPFAYWIAEGKARHIDISQGFAEVMADVGPEALPAAVVYR